MEFAKNVWKLLVGIKDGLSLLFLLLFLLLLLLHLLLLLVLVLFFHY